MDDALLGMHDLCLGEQPSAELAARAPDRHRRRALDAEPRWVAVLVRARLVGLAEKQPL